ncbi:hypothetical protein CPB85DRAFT_152859 [Mucidula mucida]|nr:hypothetical protein CPB85DRAFT_152859 [Mucidula mucida]
MSTNDAGKPSDETNSGIASPPKLPKRKSKVRPQKKPETESVPLPAPPAKRSRPVVEDEEEDVGSLRSKKRKKIGQTVPVAEEASRASSTNKRTEADQVHRELQQSFISLQKSFSACGNSVTLFERRLSKHFSHGKQKRAKPAKANIVTSTSDSFAAAKLWLSATSTAPSQDALGDNSTASTSNTTHLDAPSSTQPSSTSIFDFSLDLTNTTRNDDEDRAEDNAIEFEEANKTPTPAQSTKILRFLQEVEVFEGSERRICYLRKALDVEGDEDAELRKEAMPTKERIVDAWTVMRLTPTSSPTYEDTDEEEVDELASSPVKIKPIDHGDSEEDDEDGIESLFTPPPRKKKRVVRVSLSARPHLDRMLTSYFGNACVHVDQNKLTTMPT